MSGVRPATKDSTTTTTTTITETKGSIASNTTRCTSAVRPSISAVVSPTKNDKYIAPFPAVDTAQNPLVVTTAAATRETGVLSKEKESGSSSDQVELESTFDISQACKLLAHIVCKTFFHNEHCFAYVVKLKKMYKGVNFLRIEEDILHKCRRDLVENYAQNFVCNRLIITSELAACLEVGEIYSFSILLSENEFWYLLKIDNFENGNLLWVSEQDMVTYYPDLLIKFKQSIAAAVDTPLIIRSKEETTREVLETATDLAVNIGEAINDWCNFEKKL